MTQERSIRTRNEILRAAAEVFAEEEFGAATINEIIDRAGVTKGALYYHFDHAQAGGKKAKEQLASAILESTLSLDGIRPQPFRLQEWVDTGMVLAHRLGRETGLRAALRLSVQRNAREDYGTPWPGWVEITTGQLTAAQQNSELLPNAEPWRYARLVAGCWAGIALTTYALDGSLDAFEEETAFFYARLLPSLAAPGLIQDLDVSPDRGRLLWESHLRGDTDWAAEIELERDTVSGAER